MRLTVKSTSGLTLPPGKTEDIVFDDDVPGFGIRLRKDSRRWVFQYKLGTKQRRLTFGSVDAMGVADARERAELLHAAVKLGQDPAGQKAESKAKASETFGATVGRFLAFQRSRLRARSYTGTERYLLVHAKTLHGLQLAKIERRHIATLIAAIAQNCGAPASNRLRSALSGFFSWAIREGLSDATNPVINTNAQTERPRHRVLAPDELRLVWTHAGDDHFGSVLKLLALTGARADEIAALRWSEIRGDLAVLPPERVKSGREHEIPLCPAAREIIEAQPKRTNAHGTPRDLIFGNGQGGFSGWSSSKEKLDERIKTATGKPLPAWVVHDLRRSFSTHANEFGILPHVVEACLQSGALSK